MIGGPSAAHHWVLGENEKGNWIPLKDAIITPTHIDRKPVEEEIES